MRTGIQNKDQDYIAPAKDLYERLIVPIEAHFKQRGIAPKMLTLFLTERLRMLPFAALIDAQGSYLVQRYRLNVFTTDTNDKAKLLPSNAWGITAFGSKAGYDQLPPLPAVEQELAAIVKTGKTPKGVLPGNSYLNEEFTRARWLAMFRSEPGQTRRSVLHVATHFTLRPGTLLNSGLVLGDGKLFSVEDLNPLQATSDLSDIELLTLSACNSAISEKQSNGKEFEGLTSIFQKMGAHAVLGSLWSVSDGSTAVLMHDFYAKRGATRQMSKAKALQEAQLAMLKRPKEGDKDWAHPYHWAAFVLMGNWL